MPLTTHGPRYEYDCYYLSTFVEILGVCTSYPSRILPGSMFINFAALWPGKQRLRTRTSEPVIYPSNARLRSYSPCCIYYEFQPSSRTASLFFPSDNLVEVYSARFLRSSRCSS